LRREVLGALTLYSELGFELTGLLGGAERDVGIVPEVELLNVALEDAVLLAKPVSAKDDDAVGGDLALDRVTLEQTSANELTVHVQFRDRLAVLSRVHRPGDLVPPAVGKVHVTPHGVILG
jgi:hypothetical protein